MNFIKIKLNHLKVETKPHLYKKFIFRYNTFHPFILNNVKERIYFIQLKTNILNI